VRTDLLLLYLFMLGVCVLVFGTIIFSVVNPLKKYRMIVLYVGTIMTLPLMLGLIVMPVFQSSLFVKVVAALALMGIITLMIMMPILAKQSEKNETALEKLRQSITKTRIIDSSHTATQTAKVKTGSAIGRAIVGDIIAGPVGGFVGASTAKQKVTVQEHHTTTFMVYYVDGTRNHATVENGSALYNLYMEKLDLD